tara:strand:+ start:304 stop:843 length:540 start_codon:yes stop_codon:yes gene_type:complete
MEIADYLILNDESGTYDSTLGGFTYNIAPTWYSNQRSSVASVSMVQFSYEQDNSGEVVGYVTSSLNSQNTQFNRSSGNVLGILTPNTNTNVSYATNSYYDFSEPIKHLTSARPSNFNLIFRRLDGTAIRPDEFMIVLKFEYYSPVNTSRNLREESTPTLETVGGGVGANYYPNPQIGLL